MLAKDSDLIRAFNRVKPAKLLSYCQTREQVNGPQFTKLRVASFSAYDDIHRVDILSSPHFWLFLVNKWLIAKPSFTPDWLKFAAT